MRYEKVFIDIWCLVKTHNILSLQSRITEKKTAMTLSYET